MAGPSGLALGRLLRLIQAGSSQASMAEPSKGPLRNCRVQADLAAAKGKCATTAIHRLTGTRTVPPNACFRDGP